jgi:hypothetical protein
MSHQKQQIQRWALSLSHPTALTQILAPDQNESRRHFAIHADNARPHCGKIVTQFLDHNSLCRARYSLSSPDLDPRLLSFRVSEKSASRPANTQRAPLTGCLTVSAIFEIRLLPGG